MEKLSDFKYTVQMPTFLYIYEQHKFHAQLSWTLKDGITSGPGAGFDTLYTIYALSGIWQGLSFAL